MNVFALLILYQLKHYLADYPLQTKYMLGKFQPGWKFLGPLIAHAGVHALMTLGIVLAVKPSLAWLAAVDFIIHFAMDRIKAGPKYMGRWKALSKDDYIYHEGVIKDPDTHWSVKLSEHHAAIRGNTYFWYALGFDQMIHHLTHYFIIWMLLQ